MFDLAEKLAEIIRRAKRADNAWGRILELEPSLDQYRSRFVRTFFNANQHNKTKTTRYWLRLLDEAVAFRAAKERADHVCVAREEFVLSEKIDRRRIAGKPTISLSLADEIRRRRSELVKAHAAVLDSYLQAAHSASVAVT